jgi:hypothetical protein
MQWNSTLTAVTIYLIRLIQMINVMDTLLKKVKLDLQLTPYRVLATGPAHGFVEFVPNSHTLTSILDKYEKPNPIRKFFEQHNPKPQTLAKVLDTFVKSCGEYARCRIAARSTVVTRCRMLSDRLYRC